MDKYKVLAGLHKTRDGRTLKAGDIIESAADLEKAFPNKFLHVSTGGVQVVGSPEEVPGGIGGPPDALFAEFGNDVTSLVDHRLEAVGLRVYHKSGWFAIIDKDDSLVGDKKFRRKNLTDYLNALFSNEPT